MEKIRRPRGKARYGLLFGIGYDIIPPVQTNKAGLERKNMQNKERQLTPVEQKRKTDFEKTCEEMAQKGYLKRDLTVSVLQANIMGVIIMLPFAILALIMYLFANSSNNRNLSLSLSTYIVFLIVLLLLIVLHEAIHGLTWAFFAKRRWNAIAFGIIWKMLTPYCTCTEPLTKRQYIIGVAMPTLVLGFGLAGIAAGIGSFELFMLSEIMIFCGGGDFLIILKLLLYRCRDKEILCYDHPYECGVVAFEKK